MMTPEEILRVRRAVRHALYGCLCSMLAALAIGLGNVAYSNYLDERSHREARQLDVERARQAEETRQLVCSLALAQAAALEDATSGPGQKSRDAWRALAVRFNCT
jgi:hypothetical protein